MHKLGLFAEKMHMAVSENEVHWDIPEWPYFLLFLEHIAVGSAVFREYKPINPVVADRMGSNFSILLCHYYLWLSKCQRVFRASCLVSLWWCLIFPISVQPCPRFGTKEQRHSRAILTRCLALAHGMEGVEGPEV